MVVVVVFSLCDSPPPPPGVKGVGRKHDWSHLKVQMLLFLASCKGGELNSFFCQVNML